MPEPRIGRVRKKYYVIWYEGRQRKRYSLGTTDHALARTRFADFIRQQEINARPAGGNLSVIVKAYFADTDAISLPVMKCNWKAAEPYFGNVRASAITRTLCKTYAAERGKLVKPGTIRKELGTIRNALSWARKEGWIDQVPNIWMPPAPPPRDRRLTRDEYQRLLAACEQHHLKVFVSLAIHTAARSGAILDLRWGDVDLERRRINFRVKERQKPRSVIPINGTLLAILTEAKTAALTDHVIEYAGTGVRSIKRGFKAACARAGIEGASPHTLRHTAASWLAEGGISMAQIAQYLGHTDSKTTEKIYARFSPDFLAEAAKVLE